MRSLHPSDEPFLSLVAFAVTAVLVFVACAPKADPFVTGDRKDLREFIATPRPEETTQTPPVTQEHVLPSGKAVEETEGFKEPEGLIKFATWDDNRVSLASFIAAYVIAHGFDHPVRLVELDAEGHQEALSKGEVDIVLVTDPLIYKDQVETGEIIEVGTPFQDKPEARIALRSSVKVRDPDVVDFLDKFQPGDELLAKLTARMSGGRMGITANVAGLAFLKQNEEVWTWWVPGLVIENVKAALKEGKSGLCREWIIQLRGPYTMRTCKDDPSISVRQ